MSKFKQAYTCTHCQYETPKWMGCCPDCKQWDTFDQSVPRNTKAAAFAPSTLLSMTDLDSIAVLPEQRMISGVHEWDRVMGGGIIKGALLILTGDPGIGKSTLLLQISNALAQRYRVFYFSTEE